MCANLNRFFIISSASKCRHFTFRRYPKSAQHHCVPGSQLPYDHRHKPIKPPTNNQTTSVFTSPNSSRPPGKYAPVAPAGVPGGQLSERGGRHLAVSIVTAFQGGVGCRPATDGLGARQTTRLGDTCRSDTLASSADHTLP